MDAGGHILNTIIARKAHGIGTKFAGNRIDGVQGHDRLLLPGGEAQGGFSGGGCQGDIHHLLVQGAACGPSLVGSVRIGGRLELIGDILLLGHHFHIDEGTVIRHTDQLHLMQTARELGGLVDILVLGLHIHIDNGVARPQAGHGGLIHALTVEAGSGGAVGAAGIGVLHNAHTGILALRLGGHIHGGHTLADPGLEIGGDIVLMLQTIRGRDPVARSVVDIVHLGHHRRGVIIPVAGLQAQVAAQGCVDIGNGTAFRIPGCICDPQGLFPVGGPVDRGGIGLQVGISARTIGIDPDAVVLHRLVVGGLFDVVQVPVVTVTVTQLQHIVAHGPVGGLDLEEHAHAGQILRELGIIPAVLIGLDVLLRNMIGRLCGLVIQQADGIVHVLPALILLRAGRPRRHQGTVSVILLDAGNALLGLGGDPHCDRPSAQSRDPVDEAIIHSTCNALAIHRIVQVPLSLIIGDPGVQLADLRRICCLGQSLLGVFDLDLNIIIGIDHLLGFTCLIIPGIRQFHAIHKIDLRDGRDLDLLHQHIAIPDGQIKDVVHIGGAILRGDLHPDCAGGVGVMGGIARAGVIQHRHQDLLCHRAVLVELAGVAHILLRTILLPIEDLDLTGTDTQGVLNAVNISIDVVLALNLPDIVTAHQEGVGAVMLTVLRHLLAEHHAAHSGPGLVDILVLVGHIQLSSGILAVDIDDIAVDSAGLRLGLHDHLEGGVGLKAVVGGVGDGGHIQPVVGVQLRSIVGVVTIIGIDQGGGLMTVTLGPDGGLLQRTVLVQLLQPQVEEVVVLSGDIIAVAVLGNTIFTGGDLRIDHVPHLILGDGFRRTLALGQCVEVKFIAAVVPAGKDQVVLVVDGHELLVGHTVGNLPAQQDLDHGSGVGPGGHIHPLVGVVAQGIKLVVRQEFILVLGDGHAVIWLDPLGPAQTLIHIAIGLTAIGDVIHEHSIGQVTAVLHPGDPVTVLVKVPAHPIVDVQQVVIDIPPAVGIGGSAPLHIRLLRQTHITVLHPVFAVVVVLSLLHAHELVLILLLIIVGGKDTLDLAGEGVGLVGGIRALRNVGQSVTGGRTGIPLIEPGALQSEGNRLDLQRPVGAGGLIILIAGLHIHVHAGIRYAVGIPIQSDGAVGGHMLLMRAVLHIDLGIDIHGNGGNAIHLAHCVGQIDHISAVLSPIGIVPIPLISRHTIVPVPVCLSGTGDAVIQMVGDGDALQPILLVPLHQLHILGVEAEVGDHLAGDVDLSAHDAGLGIEVALAVPTGAQVSVILGLDVAVTVGDHIAGEQDILQCAQRAHGVLTHQQSGQIHFACGKQVGISDSDDDPAGFLIVLIHRSGCGAGPVGGTDKVSHVQVFHHIGVGVLTCDTGGAERLDHPLHIEDMGGPAAHAGQDGDDHLHIGGHIAVSVHRQGQLLPDRVVRFGEVNAVHKVHKLGTGGKVTAVCAGVVQVVLLVQKLDIHLGAGAVGSHFHAEGITLDHLGQGVAKALLIGGCAGLQ